MKIFKISSFACIISSLLSSALSFDIINLHGPINSTNVENFMEEFNNSTNKTNLIVHINSPGGSVMEGNKIITLFQQQPVICIAEKAYSMAFAILQACQCRFVLRHSTLMQHQMSTMLINEIEKINSYVAFLNEISNDLIEFQSDRIGISPEEFKQRILNDWWMTAKSAVEQNCADDILFSIDSLK